MRRWRWRIVFAVLAVTIGLLAWTRGPAVWDRAMLLYWQRQCMNYTAPKDQVVYDNDPADPKAYVASGAKALSVLYSDPYPLGYGRVPPAVKEFLARGTLRQVNDDQCVLFMHGLTSPGGTRRLVIVVCNDGAPPGGFLQSSVYTLAIVPVGWQGLPVITPTLLRPADRVWLGPVPALRIFAGQVDPNDPSHFTIRFKRIEEGMIDGRLADDGSVHLEFRGSKGDGFDIPLESE